MTVQMLSLHYGRQGLITLLMYLIIFTNISAARLALLRYMKLIHQAPGCRVLYSDTGFYLFFYFIKTVKNKLDSIVFSHPRGKNPLGEGGSFLGEMSREYASYDIMEFTAAGPKLVS